LSNFPGINLWFSSNEDKEPFESILPSAHFEKYMKLYRFKQFRKYVNLIWEDENLKETDEWWRFQPAVDEFNDIRRIRILSAFWMIVDDTMSAYRPRTSATGKLPNISYIFRKPEPLGTFFRCSSSLLSSCFSLSCLIVILYQQVQNLSLLAAQSQVL